MRSKIAAIAITALIAAPPVFAQTQTPPPSQPTQTQPQTQPPQTQQPQTQQPQEPRTQPSNPGREHGTQPSSTDKDKMPRTASSTTLIGLIGVVAFGSGIALTAIRRRRAFRAF